MERARFGSRTILVNLVFAVILLVNETGIIVDQFRLGSILTDKTFRGRSALKLQMCYQRANVSSLILAACTELPWFRVSDPFFESRSIPICSCLTPHHLIMFVVINGWFRKMDLWRHNTSFGRRAEILLFYFDCETTKIMKISIAATSIVNHYIISGRSCFTNIHVFLFRRKCSKGQ